tara:strand:+ start:412 stop:876 length:465 start_codon:yes stop_codon:yes gene_type:complete
VADARKEAAERLRKEEEFECPEATTNLKLNTENRQTAIDEFGYGPPNPNEPNDAFWQEKADMWDASRSAVRKMLCGNCRVFDVSPWIVDCMGPAVKQDDKYIRDNASSVDVGYCRIHEFKCASTRTCDVWVDGGPMDNDIETEDIPKIRQADGG